MNLLLYFITLLDFFQCRIIITHTLYGTQQQQSLKIQDLVDGRHWWFFSKLRAIICAQLIKLRLIKQL